MVHKNEDKTAIMFSVAWILHVLPSAEGLVYNPVMFEIATKRSPIDIKTIILREFVLRSGHIRNVVMIISAPSIDSEPAVVDKTLFTTPVAIVV